MTRGAADDTSGAADDADAAGADARAAGAHQIDTRLLRIPGEHLAQGTSRDVVVADCRGGCLLRRRLGQGIENRLRHRQLTNNFGHRTADQSR